MLNSKYAPIVALTVLAVIIIAVLGYFLAIKPQLDEAATIRTETEEIEQNTLQIAQESARLDQYAAEIAELEPIDDALALNAPRRFDRDGITSRIIDAVDESGLELSERSQASTTFFEGWEAVSGSLVSNQIAALFTRGPVGDPDGEEWVSPVAAGATTGSVVENLAGVPVTVTAAGSAQEALRFLQVLGDPDEQLFQLFAVEYAARNEGSTSLAGVSDAQDGDAILTISGYFYLLDPDTEVVDEEPLGEFSPPADSPFSPPEESAPEQPGAS